MTAPKSAAARTQVMTVVGSVANAPSPLPALTAVRALSTIRLGEAASADMAQRGSRGRLSSPLPYGVLSDYDRADDDVELPTIELRNEHLRVVVLPSLGGRVWSVLDLADGRELVHVNPRLRWANFGLTDAWFAGGIEWNLGSTGHGTTSNRPMHAAIIETPLGPVVRLWEWERTRDLILQVDLWLSGARLMASTRVTNLDPEPKPLYYWTNIAVPETPGTRVLVPADAAWRTDYTGVLDRVSVPFPDGPVDVSWPGASHHAADYFYEVADQEGALVTAVEPDGRGLGQTSTAELRGRKMFLWGQGPGGQRWQDWLGAPGSRYLEIQAGVCATQLEHDLLDGHASRSWTEAFVPLALDPDVVSGDYPQAAYAARSAVHDTAPPAWLAEQHEVWLSDVADLAPGDLSHVGSGWGRAELALRGLSAPSGTPFPEVEDDSHPLLRLAEGGGPQVLDSMSPQHPTLPVISDRWVARLEDLEGLGAGAAGAAGWWVSFALATGRHLRGDEEGARTAYRRSLELNPTAVAWRGLALLSHDPAERSEVYGKALALAPADRRLLDEWLAELRDGGRAHDVVTAIADLPDDVRRTGRVQLHLAQALALVGEEEAAVAVLEDLEVPNLAEGDQALSDLWSKVRPGVEVPARLDFRMTPEVGQQPSG